MRGAPEHAALAGMRALDLARRYAHGAGTQRVLGFAAVNALTRHLFDRAGYEPRAAGNSTGDLELQARDHLGMIGLFPPLAAAPVTGPDGKKLRGVDKSLARKRAICSRALADLEQWASGFRAAAE